MVANKYLRSLQDLSMAVVAKKAKEEVAAQSWAVKSKVDDNEDEREVDKKEQMSNYWPRSIPTSWLLEALVQVCCQTYCIITTMSCILTAIFCYYSVFA